MIMAGIVLCDHQVIYLCISRVIYQILLAAALLVAHGA